MRWPSGMFPGLRGPCTLHGQQQVRCLTKGYSTSSHDPRSAKPVAITLANLLCTQDILAKPPTPFHCPGPQRFASLIPSSPVELVDRFNNGRNSTWLDEAIR